MSKYIQPINHAETKEILSIYKKDREYSRLIDEKLVYFVEGPIILNIYSRKAFPSQTKKDKSYQFAVVVDEDQSLIAKHNYRKDEKVYNENHPGHSYTIAGKDVINIPKGQHRVELTNLNKKNNILVRLTTSSFKSKNKISNIKPIDHEYMKEAIAILKKNNEPYYMLSNNISQSDKIEFDRMMFKATGPTLVRIISRNTFLDDDNTYYQFKIRKNDQLLSAHHMFAEKSKNTKIINKPIIGISKWRTTLIDVPKGVHEYEIELISPSDKHVLFKIQEDSK
tara:strand:+ start:944 stop:1786 length:843 start_codon:yes stop_codon:yes gene_type:complete